MRDICSLMMISYQLFLSDLMKDYETSILNYSSSGRKSYGIKIYYFEALGSETNSINPVKAKYPINPYGDGLGLSMGGKYVIEDIKSFIDAYLINYLPPVLKERMMKEIKE